MGVKNPTPFINPNIARATREKKAFHDMVIELVKVGELDLSDSDRHEPRKQA
jgi:hypothetical protein